MAEARRAITAVVAQHVEDCSALGSVRQLMARSPHVKLHHLRRIDDRLAAHLDGVALGGRLARHLSHVALAAPGIGEVFATAVSALEEGDLALFSSQLALAETLPSLQSVVISALGWTSSLELPRVIGGLLTSSNASHRLIAIEVLAAQHVDPGNNLSRAVDEEVGLLRARALRLAGECGRTDLVDACVRAVGSDDTHCSFWAARSALLLGARGAAQARLQKSGLSSGPCQSVALSLLGKVGETGRAAGMFRMLSSEPGQLRFRLRFASYVGDCACVRWLLPQMSDLRLARLAGESFSLITGADLAWLDLDRKPPEGIDFGPNDDPDDDNVAMDEDEGLPWPDPVKVQAWWSANAHRFQPGVRYFMGAPPGWEHCLQVLKDGYQRQRMAAAEYLCLLRPGTMLFNCQAPAWRQQQWLAQMH